MEPNKQVILPRWFIVSGLLLLAIVLAADLFTSHKAHFKHLDVTIDQALWFFPILGFLGTVALVIVSKALGIGLSREDTFYGAD